MKNQGKKEEKEKSIFKALTDSRSTILSANRKSVMASVP